MSDPKNMAEGKLRTVCNMGQHPMEHAFVWKAIPGKASDPSQSLAEQPGRAVAVPQAAWFSLLSA